MVGWSKFIKLIGEERFSTDLAAQLINPNALGGEDDNDDEDDAGGTIPVTGVSNGMARGADLILQGNTLLHTARRGSTPRKWCCPCARCVSGGGGTGGGGPL